MPDGLQLLREVLTQPVRAHNPNSVGALMELAARRRAWNEAHPNAPADECLAGWAEIAEELGL